MLPGTKGKISDNERGQRASLFISSAGVRDRIRKDKLVLRKESVSMSNMGINRWQMIQAGLLLLAETASAGVLGRFFFHPD